MRFTCPIVFCCLLLASHALANYEPSIIFQESEEQFQCLTRGTVAIEPPYDEEFQFLLVYQPELSYLHFTCDYPLDPGQQGELAQYSFEHQLGWSVCYFELQGQTWSVVTMPVAGEPQELVRVFLDHLRQLSFISSLDAFEVQ